MNQVPTLKAWFSGCTKGTPFFVRATGVRSAGQMKLAIRASRTADQFFVGSGVPVVNPSSQATSRFTRTAVAPSSR